MTRLLFFLLLGGVLYFFIKNKFFPWGKIGPGTDQATPKDVSEEVKKHVQDPGVNLATDNMEDLYECPVCRRMTPADTPFVQNGRRRTIRFCSKACADDYSKMPRED